MSATADIACTLGCQTCQQKLDHLALLARHEAGEPIIDLAASVRRSYQSVWRSLRKAERLLAEHSAR